MTKNDHRRASRPASKRRRPAISPAKARSPILDLRRLGDSKAMVLPPGKADLHLRRLGDSKAMVHHPVKADLHLRHRREERRAVTTNASSDTRDVNAQYSQQDGG